MKLYSWYGNRDNFESRENVKETIISKNKVMWPEAEINQKKSASQKELKHVSEIPAR